MALFAAVAGLAKKFIAGRAAQIVGKKLAKRAIPRVSTVAGAAAGFTAARAIGGGAPPPRRRRRRMPTSRELHDFEHAMDIMKGFPTVRRHLARQFSRKFRF